MWNAKKNVGREARRGRTPKKGRRRLKSIGTWF